MTPSPTPPSELAALEADLEPCWTCRHQTFCEITHSSHAHSGALYRCVNCKAIYPDFALRPSAPVAGGVDEGVLAELASLVGDAASTDALSAWKSVRTENVGKFVVENWPHLAALSNPQPTASAGAVDAKKLAGEVDDFEKPDLTAMHRSELEAEVVHQAKLIERFRRSIANMVREIEDEGDRAYFGSTNDADELVKLDELLTDCGNELFMPWSMGDDLYADIRGLHAEVATLTREAEELRAALSAHQGARETALKEAWRDGWAECKGRLTDDEAFCLTDDVEQDAWADCKTRALAQQPAAATVEGDGWQSSDAIPVAPKGGTVTRIVAVRRSHNRQVYSFPAQYLNAMVLNYEDEPYEREITGWFGADADDDDGTRYTDLLTAGDELLGWCDYPRWPEPPTTPRARGDGEKG